MSNRCCANIINCHTFHQCVKWIMKGLCCRCIHNHALCSGRTFIRSWRIVRIRPISHSAGGRGLRKPPLNIQHAAPQPDCHIYRLVWCALVLRVHCAITVPCKICYKPHTPNLLFPVQIWSGSLCTWQPRCDKTKANAHSHLETGGTSGFMMCILETLVHSNSEGGWGKHRAKHGWRK